MTLAKRTGPLDDLTIIDCTMAFAGPFGTVLLADLGANIIKVEPPDGRIAIAAPVERHWQLLCEAMGHPELGKDDRTRNNFKRVQNQAFTEEVITNWTSTRTKQEILDRIGGSVPCGPANTMEEVFADPHVAARTMIEQYQLPGANPAVALSGNPIKFTKSQTSFYQAPPRLGEHSEEILAEFGIEPID